MTTQTWTVDAMLARKATGDTLVTHDGWSTGYETGSDIKGARLSLVKWEPMAPCRLMPKTRDERDGHIFPSVDEAQCYALNRGALIWFKDWKSLRAQGLA